MFCPFCTHEETKVVDSRLVANGSQIKEEENALTAAKDSQLMKKLNW